MVRTKEWFNSWATKLRLSTKLQMSSMPMFNQATPSHWKLSSTLMVLLTLLSMKNLKNYLNSSLNNSWATSNFSQAKLSSLQGKENNLPTRSRETLARPDKLLIKASSSQPWALSWLINQRKSPNSEPHLTKHWLYSNHQTRFRNPENIPWETNPNLPWSSYPDPTAIHPKKLARARAGADPVVRVATRRLASWRQQV